MAGLVGTGLSGRRLRQWGPAGASGDLPGEQQQPVGFVKVATSGCLPRSKRKEEGEGSRKEGFQGWDTVRLSGSLLCSQQYPSPCQAWRWGWGNQPQPRRRPPRRAVRGCIRATAGKHRLSPPVSPAGQTLEGEG